MRRAERRCPQLTSGDTAQPLASAWLGACLTARCSHHVVPILRCRRRKVKKRVQFGILGPEELKTASVVEITTDRTFENGKPVPGGLMDPALGAIDRNFPCSSCGMNDQECPPLWPPLPYQADVPCLVHQHDA